MKKLLLIVSILFFTGCSAKKSGFDQRSYDRQNNAAKESLNSI